MVEKKFDPRFDPRFQPGYEGEPIDSGRESIPASTPIADSVDVVEDVEGGVPVEPAEAGRSQELAETELLAEEEVEPNPFERTLIGVAVFLVVGGAAAAFWANSLNYYGTGGAWDWMQILQSSAWALSSPMIMAGLGTAIGLLFRRAVAWRAPECERSLRPGAIRGWGCSGPWRSFS